LNPSASANTFACCGVSERRGNIIISASIKINDLQDPETSAGQGSGCRNPTFYEVVSFKDFEKSHFVISAEGKNLVSV